MLHSPDTDLRAYSGRALLAAAAISASLHVVAALAVPEWGGGKGFPLLRRPPLIVRMEMLRERQKAEGRGQGSGIRDQEKQKQKQGSGIRDQESGKADIVLGLPRSPAPDPAVAFSPIPDPRHPTPVSADEGEKGLVLAAQGDEVGDGLTSAGREGNGSGQRREESEITELDGAQALEMWQVEEPPKQVKFVDPEYPAMARRMGVEGSVVVRYLMGQDGRVEQMTVLEGPELLREASLRAVGQFVYEPIYHRGRRTKVWMRQVITFRLE